MLWRDDNRMMHVWYDGETFRFVSMRLDLDRYMRVRYPFHIYQSFLLDYIEYLIESAIDKQLAEPIKSDIGVLRYVRENPDNLPVFETPSLINLFRVQTERQPYEQGKRSPEPCREADSCGCSRDGCPGNSASMEPIGIEQSWFTQSWPGSYV